MNVRKVQIVIFVTFCPVMNISENLKDLRAIIPPHVRIIAVSKTHPPEAINEAYASGQRCFGENRVQELVSKVPYLPADIEWHFIGHLQTNKVKQIAASVGLIHSVDSLKLLREIDKEALKLGRQIRCLFEIHIAEEESKFGLSYEGLLQILEAREFVEMKNVSISGLMGMATFTNEEDKVRKEFRFLRNCFDRIKAAFFRNNPGFSVLSMGMSGDFQIAVEEGSNMVRIGSAIFGDRYNS